MIAVFTKFDQFKRDIQMKMEDEGRYNGNNLELFKTELENMFNKQYLASLSKHTLFVWLEGAHCVKPSVI